MPRWNKYAFYEQAVQTPARHIEMFVDMYRERHGKYARHLREDFCGTFALSCEWVKRNRRNTAQCLDLDPEPLAYGKRVHRARLSSEQKQRLSVLRRNVLSTTTPKADLIIGCNFSFFILKDRATLVSYFRHCLRSLRPGGMLILEMAGGPGMIEPMRERVPVYGRDGKRKYTYIWHQQQFDPITHDARYAIHFELGDGSRKNSVFTYDWRLWTLPEVQDAMREAGFPETFVYWETEHKGRGTGEYARTGHGDNAYAWIAYVAGALKKNGNPRRKRTAAD
ncbi:MAG: class I SAM-dependent methyltransferase [Oligoflexia bacterium]|nr:class I SAM-dependent methyltransferase [Oligoflexia bacterium]